MIFNYCFKPDYKNQQSTVIALCCLRFSELWQIARYNFIRTMTMKRLPVHVTFKTMQLASAWQNHTQVAVYWEENLELLIFYCSSCPANWQCLSYVLTSRLLLPYPIHTISCQMYLFSLQYSLQNVRYSFLTFLLNDFFLLPSNYIRITARHARDRHVPQEVWDGVQKNDSLISQILQLHPLLLHHSTICLLNLLPWKAVAVLVRTHCGLKNCCCLCYLQMMV